MGAEPNTGHMEAIFLVYWCGGMGDVVLGAAAMT